ncbi:beta strand repeat-containing protein [Aeoliella sp.]|uniref:beta strand repeat-containing protein n=1 Tax=Aeoliella sp. TaxID=2795800 RepID=UPI003CCC1A00
MQLKSLTWRLGLSSFMAAVTFVTAQAQETVYFDDFSGGAVGLHGTTPDVSLTGGSWTAGAGIQADGTVLTSPSRFTALLPFTPEPNFVYSLSADIVTANTASNNWLAIGFAENSPANLDERFISNGANPHLWMISRAGMSTSNDSSFLGPGTGGGADSSTISSDHVVMTLDTTGLEWEWSIDYGGDGVDRTESLAAAPPINFVALSNTGIGGNFDNLLLTRLAVPLKEWDIDGGGSYNTATNWTDDTLPISGDRVLFGTALVTSDSAVVTIDSPVTLEEIRFANNNSYTLAGPSTLTLSGSAAVAPIQGSHTISAQIVGSNGLNKLGGGTVTLSNTSNSYTGNTNIATGVLEIASLGAINQSSGLVDVAAGATFRFTGDGAGGGASGTLTEEITGAGTIALAGVDPNTPGSPGLTTEVVTAATANPGFTGTVQVDGGTLAVANAQALGTSDGTAATGTTVAGGLSEGTLQLSSTTVADERLSLSGRQPENATPHLSGTGTSSWGGDIVGSPGGDRYVVESQAGGNLTLSGDIMLPDSSERFLVLTGQGNGTITGQIVDRTIAAGDGAENASTSVIKRGAGTWTIATTPPAEDPGVSTASDAYHQLRTIIEDGTLAVQSTGGTAGELFSRTIEVQSGGTFDISSFSNYSLQILEDPDMTLSTGDEVGQELTGAGNINVGGSLNAFDDSTISPGDSVGTLTLSGDFSYSTAANTPAGAWNFELGDTTSAGDSDRFRVEGTATINASTASNIIQVNIRPVEGTLAGAPYTLIQADSLSLSGAAGNGTYAETVFDAQGNDITAGLRQTVAVTNSGNNVVLSVTGSSANLQWQGTAGSAWDVKTTSNWSGTGGPQFSQLDHVTFGNVANKNVTVDTNVAPGSVTFDGGAGSTYTVTGSGGMTGYGPVSVNSGTVQLQNSGNDYAGSTTVASGARLEMNTASTGGMVVNGTLSVGGTGVATGGAQTFFADDFSGAGGPLNDTTPDTTTAGTKWVASSTFSDDGNVGTAGSGASATLAFTPIDGSTYVLETSLSGLTGDSDWIGAGFANGQSTGTNTASRFLSGDVIGMAWAMMRGDASSDDNQAFLGDLAVAGNSGLASTTSWVNGTNQSGGDVDIRITLDTTGGAGTWTATMEADFGSGFQTIRAAEVLLDESINSVGIPASRPSDTTGVIESFSLTGVEPAESRYDGQTISIDGDLVMDGSAALEFDIALFGQDFIDVSGSATLDGTIDVTKLGSFTPAGGAQYTLLSAAGGITDLGVNFNLPANFSASIVDMTDLVISFGMQGDFNGDGIVNLADYVVWRNNLGAADESVLMNNGDGMGGVDSGDYDLWKANFGAGLPGAVATSAQTTVPEPASLVCLLAGCVVGLAYRRHLQRR